MKNENKKKQQNLTWSLEKLPKPKEERRERLVKEIQNEEQ